MFCTANKNLCLYVPGFQRKIIKYVIRVSERSKKKKEQKKNRGSVLVAESAYNSQNTQFRLVMVCFWRALTLKISILEKFQGQSAKNWYLKIWVGRESNPWGDGEASDPLAASKISPGNRHPVTNVFWFRATFFNKAFLGVFISDCTKAVNIFSKSEQYFGCTNISAPKLHRRANKECCIVFWDLVENFFFLKKACKKTCEQALVSYDNFLFTSLFFYRMEETLDFF